MNAVFTIVFIASSFVLLFKAPSAFLSAMTSGATKALSLSATLCAIHLAWSGVYGVVEKTGLADKLAKVLKKPVRLLFGDIKNAEKDVTLNLAANLLGLGGIAAPRGMAAMRKLKGKENARARALLVVLSSCPVSLLPTSVISLRLNSGSLSADSVILPILICSLLSFFTGILLTKIFIKE